MWSDAETIAETRSMRKEAQYRRHPVFGWIWTTYLINKTKPSARPTNFTEGWRLTYRMARRAARFNP